jgi:dUTP pyrophosphatase
MHSKNEKKEGTDFVLKVKRLSKDATLPKRGSPGAAGYDLYSMQDAMIRSKGKNLIRTGICVEIPEGHYGRIAPRSSLAWINFIDVGAGVIDSDYRGEIKVVLYNFASVMFKISKGQRIAQLIIERISTPDIVEITKEEDLEHTERGFGGFGSTGT